jgi:uroporphyrinogen-III decarboxylase
MNKIKDFNCTYDNPLSDFVFEDLKCEGISFPEAYLNNDDMVQFSLAIREEKKALICELPFCHTLEAEALGGIVQMGNGRIGPRTGEYIYQNVEDLLRLPSMNFSEGRIHETLIACRKLQAMGEHVMFEISGPFTILNGLIDSTKVLRAMRKNPDLIDAVFERLEVEILRFIEQIQMSGGTLISYADSAEGLKILGPKLLTQVTEKYTYPLLKKSRDLLRMNSMLLLCPKTTFALLGTDLGKYVEHSIGSLCTYEQACIDMLGTVHIAGQMCIKNKELQLTDGIFKEIQLK